MAANTAATVFWLRAIPVPYMEDVADDRSAQHFSIGPIPHDSAVTASHERNLMAR
jgi:hypothetical protein